GVADISLRKVATTPPASARSAANAVPTADNRRPNTPANYSTKTPFLSSHTGNLPTRLPHYRRHHPRPLHRRPTTRIKTSSPRCRLTRANHHRTERDSTGERAARIAGRTAI